MEIQRQQQQQQRQIVYSRLHPLTLWVTLKNRTWWKTIKCLNSQFNLFSSDQTIPRAITKPCDPRRSANESNGGRKSVNSASSIAMHETYIAMAQCQRKHRMANETKQNKAAKEITTKQLQRVSFEACSLHKSISFFNSFAPQLLCQA